MVLVYGATYTHMYTYACKHIRTYLPQVYFAFRCAVFSDFSAVFVQEQRPGLAFRGRDSRISVRHQRQRHVSVRQVRALVHCVGHRARHAGGSGQGKGTPFGRGVSHEAFGLVGGCAGLWHRKSGVEVCGRHRRRARRSARPYYGAGGPEPCGRVLLIVGCRRGRFAQRGAPGQSRRPPRNGGGEDALGAVRGECDRAQGKKLVLGVFGGGEETHDGITREAHPLCKRCCTSDPLCRFGRTQTDYPFASKDLCVSRGNNGHYDFSGFIGNTMTVFGVCIAAVAGPGAFCEGK